MVAIYDFLWKRYIDYAKKYQLQVDTVDDFNTKIAEIQIEAITILAPYYQFNEKVRGLIEPWIRRIYDISDQNGQILRPERVGTLEPVTEEYYRLLSIGVIDVNGNILYNIDPIVENELMLCMRIPQRKPDLTKMRAYYIQYDEVIQLYPQTEISYILFYLIYPVEAKLSFTYSVVNGEYLQTYDPVNTVDLSWDKNASNILLYMLLEKYGISSRDELLLEYGKLGIKVSLEAQQIGN
jgi:hypothetical protein